MSIHLVKSRTGRSSTALYRRIALILESARTGMARSVNTTQVIANWLIGREIVEEEQQGSKRAAYGERLMHDLAAKLRQDYGSGFGLANLKLFRQLYLTFPELVGPQKGYAVRSLFLTDDQAGTSKIVDPVRQISDAPRRSWWSLNWNRTCSTS